MDPEHSDSSLSDEDPSKPVDAKTLANRKKKEKKKAQAAAKKAADSAPAAAAKPKAMSGAAKAAAERLELVKRLEEEKKKAEEAARLAEEAERKRIEEEERKEEEERQRRIAAKHAKKERLKAEGKLLTKAERERKLKGEIMRKQLEEAGLVPGADEEGSKKFFEKRKNKKNQQKQSEQVDDITGAVSAQVTAAASWEDLLSSDEDEPKVSSSPSAKEVAASVTEAQSVSPPVVVAESPVAIHPSEPALINEWEYPSRFRSPICCVMGHVDAGKTKLLDKIRHTNVQEGEAGGITQQIGATFFPNAALREPIDKVQRKSLEVEVPGLMIIDTPGHESFNNLRDRGSSLCDMAVLVVDILSGLEPQTVESLEMLRKKNCPFVVALNKIDRLYSWKAVPYRATRDALKAQKDSVVAEFKDRWQKVHLQFAEKGINVSLYWENKDVRKDVSVIPTSAMTGEGIPDLLFTLVKLSQSVLTQRITYIPDVLSCSVLEVKALEGLGTTIDVVLINGVLKEGDRIVVCGLSGAIVTTVRALLTPKPMREMRVKGEFVHHRQIRGSIGVKISAVGLEEAVAGTKLLVLSDHATAEEENAAKQEVMKDFDSLVRNFQHNKDGGVYVAASTLGSLEALLSFLSDMKIPVAQVSIGELHRSHVRKAGIMLDKKHPEFAVILAFDVKLSADAKKEAEELGVKVFTADIIYHLFDQFTNYIEGVRKAKREGAVNQAVFPCILRILPQFVFNKKDPIILGCDVVEGVLKVGAPIVAVLPGEAHVEVGRVTSIEKDRKNVDKALNGDSVAVKIQPHAVGESTTVLYGRHFDHKYQLVSQISRNSIDCLKEHFKEQMRKEDWLLVIKLKPLFKVE